MTRPHVHSFEKHSTTHVKCKICRITMNNNNAEFYLDGAQDAIQEQMYDICEGLDKQDASTISNNDSGIKQV